MLLNMRCRVASGATAEVWLTNLSPTGCQLILGVGVVGIGQRVLMRGKEIEALAGTVRWMFDGRAGVEFDAPLDPAEVERLLAAKPKAARTERGAGEFVDQFGRPLPAFPQRRYRPGSTRPG